MAATDVRLSSTLMTMSVFPVNSSAPVRITTPSPKANSTPAMIRTALALATV